MDVDLIEVVSADMHGAWMDTKRSRGVESRKAENGEELMVPYHELSEGAKDLDRGSVKSVFASLVRLGYVINKL